MSDRKLTAQDYPVAEKRPEDVAGARGKPFDSLTLDAVIGGEVEMEDLRITPQALQQQAQIARSVGRETLAENLERAAEMTRVPQDEVMQIYELLRPGRAPSREALHEAAERLRATYDAPLLAGFVDEAAERYEQRGLFRKRF